MQKKNIAATPSAQLITPSNQPLASEAPTTTVPAPAQAIPGQESIQLPSPAEDGISGLAPSTSASLPPKITPKGRDIDQTIINKVVRDQLMNSKFRGADREPMVDTFFKSLKKYGYSDDQLEAAKAANQDLNALMIPIKLKKQKQVEGISAEPLDKEILKQINPLRSQWGILQPLADWSNDFADKTIQGIEEGKEKIAQGLTTMGSQTGGIETPVRGALQITTGGVELFMNTNPVAIEFNAATDGIKTVADKNLSKENAEMVNSVMDAPFSLATKAAAAMGFNPGQESNWGMVLQLGDFVGAAGLFVGGKKFSEGFKNQVSSIKGLKDISEKAAKKELTPEEQSEFNQYATNLKSVTLDDIKNAAIESETPEGVAVAEKIDQVKSQVAQEDINNTAIEEARITHISDMKAMEEPGSKEFYDKAMQALDNPAIVDRIKNSLNEAVAAGEIPVEEAQSRIDHFRKIVGIDQAIPDKISDAADRMEAGKLLEKKSDLKESIRGLDPILAADEITKVNNKIEKIDEKLNELKNAAKEKAKIKKQAAIPEAPIEGEIIKTEQYATKEGIIKEGDKPQYPEGDEARRSAEAGDSNRPIEGGEISQKEVIRKELSPYEAKVEKALSKDLSENYEERKKEYHAKYDNVFDTDRAREISPEYRDNPELLSSATQIPAREFVNKMYQEELAKPAPEGKENSVTFMAGGSGVGKSVMADSKASDSQIIVDTNLSTFDRAVKDIDEAINAGKDVHIAWTYRDPYKAFVEGVMGGKHRKGRTVPYEVATDINKKSLETIKKLSDHYKDSEKVDFTYIDNNYGKENPQLFSLDDVKKINFDYEKAKTDIKNEIERQHNAGEITDEQYHGFIGDIQKGLESRAAKGKLGGETVESIQEVHGGGKIEPPAEKVEPSEAPQGRTHAIWSRILPEIQNEELRKSIESKGVDYVVKNEKITESAAQELLDAAIKIDDLSSIEKVVLNESNKMDETVRGVLSAMLGKHYYDLAEKTIDPIKKAEHEEAGFDYTQKAASMATEGGQIGNAVGKAIKKMWLNNPDVIVKDAEIRMRKSNEKTIDQEKAKNTYEEIKKILESPEGQKAVTEEISKKQERLFGKETQKKISDFFDSAKIKGGTYGAIIPPPVINAAIETMKQAALLGAKGAAIIEEGILYIRANHKGEFDEEAFKKEWEKKLKSSGVKFGKKRGVSEKETQSILDAIEKKAERFNEKNKNQFLKDVITEVEKEGGLSESRFKDMYAKALGLPTMTEELSANIKSYSKVIREGEQAKKTLAEAYDKVIQEKADTGKATDASSKELSNAKKEMNKAAREADKAESELSSIVRDKKDFADTFISLMQLNVLTPISTIRNIVGVAPDFLVIRPVSNLVAGATDFLRQSTPNISGISKLVEAQKEINPIARTKGAWLGAPDAIRNFYTAMITGETPGKFGQRNMFNKLEPKKAAQRIINALQGKDKMKASEWATAILESTAGIPASIMGRSLVGPDVFVRTLAEQSKLYEAGWAKGLRGEALEKFVKLPEGEPLEAARSYADEITYQQQNKISSAISSLGRKFKASEEDSQAMAAAKSTARILGTTQALFVKTPTNVLWQSTKLAFPEIPLAQGLIEWKKGNKVEAERQFGYAATGFAIRLAMSEMASRGIISPVTNYDEKKRLLEDNEGKHGGQINYSRMLRYLSFQDGGEKDSDMWIDYKWLGPLGLVMGVQGSLAEEQKKTGVKMGYGESSLKGGLYSIKYASELPYVQSMGALADAMKDPEKFGNQWISSVPSTLASGVAPRTITQFSRASTDDLKKVYDRDLGEYIKNKFKYDYFMGDELPSKINLWGENIANAPKGNNPYAWYVLDFYKDRNPEEQSLSYRLQMLHEKTNDDNVIPAAPSDKMTISKQKVQLTPKEHEQLQIYVGKRRAELVKAYMVNGSYKTDGDDVKIDKLQDIYREGSTEGKNMLISSTDRLTNIQNESGGTTLSGSRRKKMARPMRKMRTRK